MLYYIEGEFVNFCFWCKWVVGGVVAILLPHTHIRLIVGYYKLLLIVSKGCTVFFELGLHFLGIPLYGNFFSWRVVF